MSAPFLAGQQEYEFNQRDMQSLPGTEDKDYVGEQGSLGREIVVQGVVFFALVARTTQMLRPNPQESTQPQHAIQTRQLRPHAPLCRSATRIPAGLGTVTPSTESKEAP